MTPRPNLPPGKVPIGTHKPAEIPATPWWMRPRLLFQDRWTVATGPAQCVVTDAAARQLSGDPDAKGWSYEDDQPGRVVIDEWRDRAWFARARAIFRLGGGA